MFRLRNSRKTQSTWLSPIDLDSEGLEQCRAHVRNVMRYGRLQRTDTEKRYLESILEFLNQI